MVQLPSIYQTSLLTSDKYIVNFDLPFQSEKINLFIDGDKKINAHD